MTVVTTKTVERVMVVAVDYPPVNALGAAVRSGLLEAVAKADGSDEVDAVVIIARGKTFFAGADLSEFGKPPISPSLPETIDGVERCAKPVVAAIHGTALGGGLEVALGCHYRIATSSARFGLPEVKLGMLPGAGGTQRLPRLVGIDRALSMIVTGDPITADSALAAGLVDRLAGEQSLETDALAFAQEVATRPGKPVTSLRGDRIVNVDPQVFDRFRQENARLFRGFEAPDACLKALRAAVELPIAEGLRLERELFLKLRDGSQARALRHKFFAERMAGKIEGLPEGTAPLPVERVGVLGAGTMGGGIAITFLSVGIPVTLVERDRGALDRGVAAIRRNLEAGARKGKATGAAVERAMALLTPALRYEDLAQCDLVIEAVFEDMAVKKDVFRRLDAICRPGAVLASNTSYLDLDEIAAATGRPEWVVGLHFFSPANIMRLLEVVRGKRTAPSVLATAMTLAKRIGKIAVVAGVCDGFIGNRMLKVRRLEADHMLLQGATPWAIDEAMVKFGFPMGPFQISDLAGLDLGWTPDSSTSSTIREILCERGRRGQKTGKGFYDYDDRRKSSSSSEVEEIIAGFARRHGLPAISFTEEQIVERLLYPMVNEGTKILEEGIAQRASDIDVVWLNGFGWPAWTGGPMYWAEAIGMERVLAGLERHAEAMNPTIRISDTLRRLIRESAPLSS